MFRTLVNVNPVAELQQVAELMDRAFNELRPTTESKANEPGLTLPVDVYERDNNLIVKAAVPGVAPDQLDISVDENVLTIKGEMTHSFEQNDTIYRREYRYGQFTRSIRLPENINVDGISAEFENGFVTISVPRVAPIKPEPKKIEVRSANNEQKALTQDAEQSESNQIDQKNKKKVEAKQPAHLS